MSSTESPHQQIPGHLFVCNDAPSGFHADSLATADSPGNSRHLSLSPFPPGERHYDRFWLLFLVHTKTFPICDGFSIPQAHLFMELMVCGRKGTLLGSTGPPRAAQLCPGTARTLLLLRRFRPLGREKASISFEDPRTILSSFTGSRDLTYHRETRPSHLSKSDFTAGAEFCTGSQKTLGKIFWPWSYQGKRSLIHFPADRIRQEINLRILMLLFTFNQPNPMKKQQLHFLGKQAPSWIRGLLTKSRWAIRS